MVTTAVDSPTKSIFRKCKNKMKTAYGINNPTFKTPHTPQKRPQTIQRQCSSDPSLAEVHGLCEKLFQDRPSLAAAMLDSWRPNDSSSAPVSPQFKRKNLIPKIQTNVPTGGQFFENAALKQSPKSASVYNLSTKISSSAKLGGSKDASCEFKFSTSDLRSKSPQKYASAIDLSQRQLKSVQNNNKRLSAELNKKLLLKSKDNTSTEIKRIFSSLGKSLSQMTLNKRSLTSDSTFNLRSSVLKANTQRRVQRAEMVDVTSNISMDDLNQVLQNHQAFLLDVDDGCVEIVGSCCKLNAAKRLKSRDSLKFKPGDFEHFKSKSCSSLKKPDYIHPTMRDVINCSESRQGFHNFLRNEYSEENLDFWISCERYRYLRPAERKHASVKIYETFLKVSAFREINIDHTIRYNTEQRMKNPDAFVFMEAQESIYKLMEQDSFRRYMGTLH